MVRIKGNEWISDCVSYPDDDVYIDVHRERGLGEPIHVGDGWYERDVDILRQ